jgi:hypothetical protein
MRTCPGGYGVVPQFACSLSGAQISVSRHLVSGQHFLAERLSKAVIRIPTLTGIGVTQRQLCSLHLTLEKKSPKKGSQPEE